MRRGEIMNLTLKDIDLVNQTIKLEMTKNGRPRLIPLKGLAHTLIFSIIEKRDDSKQTDLLFPSPSNPRQPYDIQTAWMAALKRADIKDFTFHSNRHSHASLLAAQGRSLLEIGNSLGHESQQTTKRYAHLTNKHTTKMIEELNQELFGDKNEKK